MICSLSLFSQTTIEPAFIITNHNDTLYGVGSMSSDQKYCSFKKIGATDFISYYPTEIKGFRFIDDKCYVSKEVKEPNSVLNWYFLEYLVDGEIDLFAIPSAFRYFIKKENADLFELKDNIKNMKEIDGNTYLVQNKRYLGYIRAYMSDAPQLFSEIDKMRKLNSKDLVKLSVNYHHAVCTDYECVNYTKKISNYQSKVELVTGVTRHNDYYSPKVGVLYYHPIKSDRIFIKTGVLYSDRAYWRKEKSTEDYEFNLKIPLSIEYIFSRRNFKPTIGLGWPTGLLAWSGVFPVTSIEAGFIYSVTKNWEVSMNGSVDGLYYLTIDEHYLLYNNSLGHSLSFGIIYNLGQNKKSTASTSTK